MNLPELVSHYVGFGITKRNAVAHIIDCRMRAHQIRGKGNRAKRRRTSLAYERFATVGRDLQALADRIAANRARQHADVSAEQYTEGRQRRALASIVNPHE